MKYQILGYAFLFVAIAAVISIAYNWDMDKRTPILPPPVHQSEPMVDTYYNQDYDFEIQYLKDYELEESNDIQNYFRTSGKSIASITIPETFFLDTNFNTAYVGVAVREGTSKENCIYYTQGTPQEMSEITMVNSYFAYTENLTEGAAGTRYQTRLYHIPHQNLCLEIQQTVAVSNLDNYEPGTVKPVNEENIWNRLDEILFTFEFTN